MVNVRLKKNNIISIILLLFLCAILSACGSATGSPLSSPIPPANLSSQRESLTPASSLDNNRSFTASQSFPVALEAANQWRLDAEWYGIVPFTSIERAFAIPLDNNNPSWFFRFGVPGSETEFIVEVLNGKVVGTNVTKIPDYIEPALEDLEPLGDKWTIMDNESVLEEYLKEENNLLVQSPHLLVDYRLAKPKGQLYPVWTLYYAENLAEPIFTVNAITGETLLGK